VEFLDSVLEKTRAEEERVRRETAEGLQLFRRQQEEADRKARAAGGKQSPEEVTAAAAVKEEEQWIAAGRKRKRAKEKEGLKGVKIRKSSSSTLEPAAVAASPSPAKEQQAEETKPASVPQDDQPDLKSKTSSPAPVSKASPAAPKAGLGLVDYGSDEDDD
jgi:ATPase subunit of ABC transporter with duplicated ATPase domains